MKESRKELIEKTKEIIKKKKKSCQKDIIIKKINHQQVYI